MRWLAFLVCIIFPSSRRSNPDPNLIRGPETDLKVSGNVRWRVRFAREFWVADTLEGAAPRRGGGGWVKLACSRRLIYRPRPGPSAAAPSRFAADLPRPPRTEGASVAISTNFPHIFSTSGALPGIRLPDP